MLFRGQVVAEYEVKLILAVPHPRDRRDRVVRLAACLGEDHCVGVAVLAPFRKDSACEVTELLLVRRVQAQHRHRIFHDAAVHILKARNLKAKFLFCLLHRERMVSALKMLVRENAAADDGKVGIRAEEIMRELLDERKQLVKRRAVDDHRRVLGVHHDRVFIVIDVGRILESPRLAVHGHRHDAQILPRRVRNGSRIADVFDAEQAFRISPLIWNTPNQGFCLLYVQSSRRLKLQFYCPNAQFWQEQTQRPNFIFTKAQLKASWEPSTGRLIQVFSCAAKRT